MRNKNGRYLAVPIALVLLFPFQAASAAVPITSGSTQQMGNTLVRGSTGYVVEYAYPSVAQVGTNFTIGLTLHVISMTGLLEYIINYYVEAEIFVGTHELHATATSPPGAPRLYPGSRWGQNNVTIPLTVENTGLAPGESANATVGVIVSDTFWIGIPYNTYQVEPPVQGLAGTLVIQNPGSTTSTPPSSSDGGGQSYLPYALLASGAFLMVAAALLPRRPE